MSDRRGSLGLNLLLLALSLALTALVAEGGLRLLAHFQNKGLLATALSAPVSIPASGKVTLGHMIRLSPNPRIIYEFKPDLDVTFIDAPVTINAAGFRGPLHPEAKPPDTRRIVGLGDSFMFGHGVGEGEVYMQVLEELLNRFAVDDRFEVVNTAVPGYNTVMEVGTLETRGLAYDPDVVIDPLCRQRPRAAQLHPRREAGAGARPLLSGRPAARRLQRVERSRRSCAATGWRDRRGSRAPAALSTTPTTRRPQYRSMVGWQAWEAAMEELAALAGSTGSSRSWSPSR